jgi:hypothetical protein
MSMYVATIKGRAIAVFDAENRTQAEEYINGLAFHHDLMVLESDGQPLWDGRSEIGLRDASTEETAIWVRSANRWPRPADENDVEKEEGLMHQVFLVPVTDPTSDPELYT